MVLLRFKKVIRPFFVYNSVKEVFLWDSKFLILKIIVNKKLYVRSGYMPDVVDFYQYKYSRSNYYINLVFEKEKIKNIKKSIEDGFDDLFINKEYEYAYERLQILFEDALKNEDMGYVNLRINKCYIKYLKNLYFSYYNKPESHDIKELIIYIQFLSDSESENISKFTTLSERTKLSILSYI